jgi:hypothetical protein
VLLIGATLLYKRPQVRQMKAAFFIVILLLLSAIFRLVVLIDWQMDDGDARNYALYISIQYYFLLFSVIA